MRKKKYSKIDLKSLFMDLQKEMLASLSTSRKHIPHAPSKGDATENDWKEWIRKYFPERYKVEKAFIIDLSGNISEQIDLVVFDRTYSPFLFNHENSYYVPVESVYAAFEVKQVLNKANMNYAAKKAASIRKLSRTSGLITCIDGSRKRQELKPILFGLLCTSSSWKPPLGKKIKRILSKFIETDRINIICCIRSGAFDVLYENNNLKLIESSKNEALLFFFLKLFSRLQQIGNVPALDIDKYLKALKIHK
jgi:hypothetical protein